MTPERLAGRTALVTGAGAGIGRAIAARLRDEGARVVVFDIDRTAVADAADELGDRVQAVTGSVAHEADVAAAVDAAIAWTGALDIVVNNAGMASPENAPLEQLTLADWQRVIDVNLTGMFLVARAAAPHLRAARGTMINLASTRAFMSEPDTEAYTASKGGILALTHALANSLAPDVRVNAIAPGWIATDAWKPRAQRKPPELRPADHDQHPAGRVGRPEDVAALAAYLASSEATFVTGQTFIVDGGMTTKMIYVP
ncbi:MAG TPA: glucose 1-dehydrogenase [Kofleriaceae bacterium]|nr:glucose 1-dehydrogenase [Kofleriaceae bacterium]